MNSIYYDKLPPLPLLKPFFYIICIILQTVAAGFNIHVVLDSLD